MTTEATSKELLTRAADIIGKRGWYQGDYISPAGCVCVLGALRIAAAEAPETEAHRVASNVSGYFDAEAADAVDEASNVLADSLNVMDVADWNDASGRTADEVVAALRTAAEAGGPQ